MVRKKLHNRPASALAEVAGRQGAKGVLLARQGEGLLVLRCRRHRHCACMYLDAFEQNAAALGNKLC